MQHFWTLLNCYSLLTIMQLTDLLCLYTLVFPVRWYSWASGPARLPAFTFGFFLETQPANPCALVAKHIKAALTPASMIQHGDTLPAGLPWTSAPDLSSALLPEPLVCAPLPGWGHWRQGSALAGPLQKGWSSTSHLQPGAWGCRIRTFWLLVLEYPACWTLQKCVLTLPCWTIHLEPHLQLLASTLTSRILCFIHSLLAYSNLW